MPPLPPDLSIVLVSWNARPLTVAALRSIVEHVQRISYEIIMVDNGSGDGSPAAVKREFPWVTLIENGDNLGFSKASNQGLRVARGRYLLLLNTDTLQTGNALGESVHYMDEHRDVGVLGIRHLNADAARSIQPSCFAFPSAWRDIAGVIGLYGCGHGGDVTGERDVDWLCGSFFLMRRECLDAVGMLDERFFVYDEDIDWCRRAWAAGWRVRFWPGVAIIHHGAASRSLIRDKTFMHLRSHLSYIAKHHSSIAACAYYAAMSARLAAGTLWQAPRFTHGGAAAADLASRFRRYLRVVLLAEARRGGL